MAALEHRGQGGYADGQDYDQQGCPGRYLRHGFQGLSVVLAFIGVKLIMEALHGNTLPFINGGQPLEAVPDIPTWASLLVIVLAVGIAALASILKSRRQSLKIASQREK